VSLFARLPLSLRFGLSKVFMMGDIFKDDTTQKGWTGVSVLGSMVHMFYDYIGDQAILTHNV